MTPKQKSTMLKELRGLTDKDFVTREELVNLIKSLVSFIKSYKDELREDLDRYSDAVIKSVTEETDTLLKEAASLIRSQEIEIDDDIKTIAEANQATRIDIQKAITKLEARLEALQASIPSQPDLTPLQERLDAVAASIPTIPPMPDIPDPITATEMRDQLENLPEGEKLAIVAIEGLRAELDDLRKVTQPGVHGGVSNLRIQQAFKYILKTEQPSGLINGSNTAYTVTQPIFAVLSFTLNGETIAQLPNYTVSGRTITFATALPAAYSGKDFEIKYI